MKLRPFSVTSKHQRQSVSGGGEDIFEFLSARRKRRKKLFHNLTLFRYKKYDLVEKVLEDVHEFLITENRTEICRFKKLLLFSQELDWINRMTANKSTTIFK